MTDAAWYSSKDIWNSRSDAPGHSLGRGCSELPTLTLSCHGSQHVLDFPSYVALPSLSAHPSEIFSSPSIVSPFVYTTDIAYEKWVELKGNAVGSLSWSEFGAGRRHCEQPDQRAVLCQQDRCNFQASSQASFQASAGGSRGSD